MRTPPSKSFFSFFRRGISKSPLYSANSASYSLKRGSSRICLNISRSESLSLKKITTRGRFIVSTVSLWMKLKINSFFSVSSATFLNHYFTFFMRSFKSRSISTTVPFESILSLSFSKQLASSALYLLFRILFLLSTSLPPRSTIYRNTEHTCSLARPPASQPTSTPSPDYQLATDRRACNSMI